MDAKLYNNKLPDKELEKFYNVLKSINNLNNSIPQSTKSVFNFKGRKCETIAAKVIETLTTPESKVCDPFNGTGSFSIASSSIPRKTLAIELDNYTYSVVQALITDINYSKIENMFKTIKSTISNKILDLYTTTCCNNKNYIKILYFDPENQEYFFPKPNREIKNNKNIKLYHKCPICNSTSKQFDIYDKKILDMCNTLDTSSFPSHKLIENSRINITSSTGADIYSTNFSNRNKYALLLLQKTILELTPSIERDVLEHILVSCLTLSRIAQYGSGSEYIYQVIRNNAQEMNVWYLFETKYKNFIRYKKDYQQNKKHLDENNNNYLTLLQGDYYKLLSSDKYSNVFDLIYTDPPYTDQVTYLERSQLYRDWLCIFYDHDKFQLTQEMLNDELVVTNAPTRSKSKTIEKYFKDIDKMFNVFYKCTTDRGIIALTLNLGKNKYFKTLSEFINKARKNGFEYVYRIDLSKNDPSLRKQAAFKNTLSKEMLIFFIKLPEYKQYWYIGDKNIELEISRFLYSLIMKNKGITLTSAIREIHNNILNSDKYEDDYTNKKIKKIINEQFILEKSTSMIYIDPDKLYLSIEDNSSLFLKLYDIVPTLINNLLISQQKFTLDDLYFEISKKICNGDIDTLNQILEDSTNEKHIKLLINNYCDSDKNTYIRKKSLLLESQECIDISVLDGYKFEEILKDLLEAKGYIDVVRIGGAGDRGVDLMAKKLNPSTNKYEGYIFQSKRWISNVGGEPIQRLHSIWMQYPSEIQHAICITTSDYTKQGVKESESTKVKLINGEQLIKELNVYFPNKYTHTLLNFKF